MRPAAILPELSGFSISQRLDSTMGDGFNAAPTRERAILTGGRDLMRCGFAAERRTSDCYAKTQDFKGSWRRIMMKQHRNGLADVLVSPRLAAWLLASPLPRDLVPQGSLAGDDILALGLLGGATAAPASPAQDDDEAFSFARPDAAKRPAADDEEEGEDEDEDDDEEDDLDEDEDDADEDEEEDDDLDDDEDEDEDEDDDEDEDEEDDDFLDDDDDDDYDDDEEDFAGEDE